MNLTSKDRTHSKVAIVFRPHKAEAKREAIKIKHWLENQGAEVFFPQLNDEILSNTMDFWIAVGGDGTYLRALRSIGTLQTPILGVNMGSLGFLTETPLNQAIETLELILSGQLEPQKRTLLRARVFQSERLVGESVGLNDVVIERGNYTQLLNMSVRCNTKLIGELKADAIILATPTGSTAYNLAAGGPLIFPNTKSFVLTPVCPHALTSRPLILPEEVSIEIQISEAKQKGLLTIDGTKVETLNKSHRVLIDKSPHVHCFYGKPPAHFLTLIREKLKFGLRT